MSGPSLLPSLAVAAGLAGAAWGGDVAAVCSSEAKPYREALAGLEEQLHAKVPTFFLSQGPPQLPPGISAVVAFGSKAALREYPGKVRLIYVLAPAARLQTPAALKVLMAPAPHRLLAELVKLQPGLKRLGVFYASASYEAYVEELRAAASRLGLVIEGREVSDEADLPDLLRSLHGRIDAFWLAPDPPLLSSANLTLFRDYSLPNAIPFYVPTAGLLSEQATASVGTSFRQMGRMAAAALGRQPGEGGAESVYPEDVEVVVNAEAAEHLGLKAPLPARP